MSGSGTSLPPVALLESFFLVSGELFDIGSPTKCELACSGSSGIMMPNPTSTKLTTEGNVKEDATDCLGTLLSEMALLLPKGRITLCLIPFLDAIILHILLDVVCLSAHPYDSSLLSSISDEERSNSCLLASYCCRRRRLPRSAQRIPVNNPIAIMTVSTMIYGRISCSFLARSSSSLLVVWYAVRGTP